MDRYVSVFLLCELLFPCAFIRAYVISTDPTFSRWPINTVNYVFNNTRYSTSDQTLIRTAMAQITSDTGGCIQWNNLGVSGTPSRNLNFVIISRSGGPGTPSPTCYTYPGMITQQSGRGQHMSIQSSCMGSVRQAMRILANVLGLRPEFNKPNRSSFITVNTAAAIPAVVSAGTFNILNASAITYNSNEFDYNSITMLDNSTYSATGSPVLTSITATPINNIGRLSIRDCQAINFIYHCNTTCQDVYGNGPLPTQLTTTASSVTIVSGSASTSTSALCSPNFPVDAAWNDYTTHKLYFVSNNLVYVVQNGQIVENGTSLTTDFPGPVPSFSLPLTAGYYQSGTVNLIDQKLDSYLFVSGVFGSETANAGPPGTTAFAGYGNTVAAATNPTLNGVLLVNNNNAISFIGLTQSTSPKALTTLFATNATLVADLTAYTIEEIYSVIDPSSGAEKVAFLYQPTGRPLQYFDAVPCSATTMLDASSQVCLTLSTSPRSFASTIAACNTLPFG